MSSIIVSFTREEAIIASDSRNTKLDGAYFDLYPKIYQVNNALVAVAGVNSYEDKEIGEMYSGFDAFMESLQIAEKIMIPEGLNTEFAVLEYKNNEICYRNICVDHLNRINITKHSFNESPYRVYGVKHCIHCDKYDFNTPLNISTIRNMITLDREVDKMVKKTSTVGGAIQMYKISEKGIEDLSDKNAPRDFVKYKQEIEAYYNI